MALVTPERYAAVTTDEDSDPTDVADALAEAVEALEELLDRPLEHDERTERLHATRDGRLWPRATPITDGGDYQVDGESLRSSATWPFDPLAIGGTSEAGVEVTYSGGFVERTDNPDATNRLPGYIERDLCFAAYRLRHAVAPTSDTPQGATSVSVGDVSVTYGPQGAPGRQDALEDVWSKKTLSWRYAPLGARSW